MQNVVGQLSKQLRRQENEPFHQESNGKMQNYFMFQSTPFLLQYQVHSSIVTKNSEGKSFLCKKQCFDLCLFHMNITYHGKYIPTYLLLVKTKKYLRSGYLHPKQLLQQLLMRHMKLLLSTAQERDRLFQGKNIIVD